MPLPFKVDPEPPKRSADADPFLEFASERPGMRVSGSANEPLLRPEPLGDRLEISRSDPTLGLGQPRRTSALSPAFAFGLGVAGLVMAGVAYYQLSQVLSTRTTQSQTDAAPETPAPASAARARTASAPPSTAVDPITSAPLPPGTGRVDVASYPPGAVVTLNGTVRGVTPYILTALPAGRHTIVISRGASSVTRTIELSPGEATAVAVALPGSAGSSTPRPTAGRPVESLGGPPASPGWVTFETPIELQVFQDGKLRGTTTAGNITLPSGTHNVVLFNPALEYREVVSITVTAGRTTQSRVVLPSGSLSVNALPWAEVFVDGNAVGTTPLANLSIPIGTHEVLWRHPTLGDRRQVVVVKAKTPERVGVDFTR